MSNNYVGLYNSISALSFSGENAKSTGLSSEKNGQGAEYFSQEKSEDTEMHDSPYADRGALLTATLNSFAIFNVANILKSKTLTPSQEELS